ncbi:hypothetical protein EOPP23_06870 [Endozoicomonas sp. OPT23]|uniref:hypothetical protein n=1 Tax=Endozoicomonas sp. OPT23 TaxID=2072845 RepID=UPI00129B6660|nr:hypothetical protein [Endozoicomonas sp. OPT23]MRI32708.1 hypothetical protein [Endozoicomonas sp. OPT23]
MANEKLRHDQQQAFIKSGQPLMLGTEACLPLPLDQLLQTTPESPWVVETFTSGLTSEVYRIHSSGLDWCLKRKREQSRVLNTDGELAFINEVQRRIELQTLKDGSECKAFRHIVDTTFASLLDGIILSPWLSGKPLDDPDERVLDQLFSTIVELELAGFFEWDLSAGNIVDNGDAIGLFDFGYMYRFDPLTSFNSNGPETAVFNGIERFETRFLIGWLMAAERNISDDEKLDFFGKEKTIAVKHYQNKLQKLTEMKAGREILDGHARIIQNWEKALKNKPSLEKLWLAESHRSAVLDLLDDLHGKSCTPATLTKADYVLEQLEQNYSLLNEQDSLLFDGKIKSKSELLEKYRMIKKQAEGYQLVG